MIHVDNPALSYRDKCVLNYMSDRPLLAMRVRLFRCVRGMEEIIHEEDFESEGVMTRLKTDRVTTIRFKATL
jgi:hypothetical protein